jgi:hypothetical protein
MAKETKSTEIPTLGMDQAQQAIDTYFDFLKRSVASCPAGGVEFGEKLKDQAAENINAAHEHVKNLSQAKDFGRALQIQTEFMQSQVSAFARQATSLAQAFTKVTGDIAKKTSS